ncbi:MAG: hypothetical protein IPL23_20235 [Saprospiraceae bacterium]|nr:hypothetical protein [Saprospiraceae bacterium]
MAFGFLPVLKSFRSTYWGNVRSFGPGNPDVAVDPPLPYSTDPNSPFYKEAQDVYLISQGLTASQKIIAEYWSDDPGKTATPPGHSLSIAKIVVTKQNANLGKAVETYAKWVWLFMMPLFLVGKLSTNIT